MASTLPSPSAPRWAYALIGLLALIGLSLRIAAAHGGLWLDEAWSAVFARDAGSALDIFFTIRHDNNHYLNTLWLYLTGWGAPPVVSRLFSIVTGTLTIVAAGMIGLRRGPLQGIVFALFFALSPILVAYGAEARGYAPMFLALTVAIWVVLRWLDHPESRAPSLLLAPITAFGMLSHLTMLFGLLGIGLWATAVLMKGRSLGDGMRAALDLFGPAALVAIAILACGVLIPLLSANGYQVGSYEPFSLVSLSDGISILVVYALGLRGIISYGILLSLVLLLPLLLGSRRTDRTFFLLCIISLVTVPLLFLIARIGNAGFGRYQLLTGFGLLLVASEIIAQGITNKAWWRPIAIVSLVLLIVGQMTITLAIVANKRGDPAGAISALAARAPNGATVLVGHNRDVAVVEAAAASAHYPVRVSQEVCGGAQFLFLEEPTLTSLPPHVVLCDVRYERIADGARTEVSGMSWRLYRQADGQAARRSSAARSTS
jgi:hypothetical protein